MFTKPRSLLRSIKRRFRNKPRDKQTLFIFGCQRSGTTITSKILGCLPDAYAYPEVNSELTDQDQCELPDRTIRLNPLDDVRRKIASKCHRLVVVKPIVESQRAMEILNYFRGAKALWLYRSYPGVVNSMSVKWGAEMGATHLAPYVEGDLANWRSENVSSEVRNVMLTQHSRGISGAEGWGLFWYARNSLFFSQELNKDDRCVLIKYEKLVQHPPYLTDALKRLGINVDFQYANPAWSFHNDSVEKGQDVLISQPVKRALDEMQERLDAAEERQGLRLL